MERWQGSFPGLLLSLGSSGTLSSHTPSSWFVKRRQLCQPHRTEERACRVLAELQDCKTAVVGSSVASVSSKSVAFGGSGKREVPACASEAVSDVGTA